jgi:hypothetical protein
VAVETIERMTGRRVYSSMCAYDPSRQMQVEFFVLESDVDEAPGIPEQHDVTDLTSRLRAARTENADARESLRALRAEQRQARSTQRRQRAD